jgi:hypothetical protein
MKKVIIFIFLLIELPVQSQQLNGYYLGKEKLEMWVDYGSDKRSKKIKKWFHLNHLLIDGDSIYIYKEPVRIIHGDTLYSASDGAFYYYLGKINYNESEIISEISLTNCDYCIWPLSIETPYSKNPDFITTQIYKILPRHNFLYINNVKYKLIKNKKFPFNKDGIRQLFKHY